MKARSRLKHLIIWGLKVSRFGKQQTSFSAIYQITDFSSCFGLSKEQQEMQ